MASPSQAIGRLALDAEEIASALRDARDRHIRLFCPSITEAVARLFSLSNNLQQLAGTYSNSRYQDSLHRIRNDVQMVCFSIRYTFEVMWPMASRPPETQGLIWGDLDNRMKVQEGMDLLERLHRYQFFVHDVSDQVRGQEREDLPRQRSRIHSLLRAQEDARLGVGSFHATEPVTSNPRPTIMRPSSRSSRHTPSDFSDLDYDDALPLAPEPPLDSPTFTLNSSPTAYSSQTSSYGFPPSHWAEDIFNGQLEQSGVRSSFRGTYQIGDIETRCMGTPQPDARHLLAQRGFRPLTTQTFVDTKAEVTFYHRPSDNRARLLFSEIDSRNRVMLYSLPLNSLKAIRHCSILQLCGANSDGSYRPWAYLKFIYFERLALFYSTFVALKRQDSRETPGPLIDDPSDMDEEEHYGGLIRVGNHMLHALRLFECRGSGVVRLEARAFRGSKEEVPIWTAFLTKYARDGDDEFFGCEYGSSLITMIRPKPEPFYFQSRYALPRTSHGDYRLQFASIGDASDLKASWNKLCNSARRI